MTVSDHSINLLKTILSVLVYDRDRHHITIFGKSVLIYRVAGIEAQGHESHQLYFQQGRACPRVTTSKSS